jgi:hypothetical protein
MRKGVAVRSIFLLAALSLIGCAGIMAPGDDVPSWVASLIRQMEAEPVSDPPAFIARYEYRGAEVYYVPPSCCDVPSTLYDASGTVICHPDGGFSGDGDGRCPDFLAERRNEKIVWRDRRG